MKLREFIHPASLEEARAALRDLGPKGLPLAGGTALNFMQNHTPKVAVDITRLGLSFVHAGTDYYTVGATTALADLQRYRGKGWAMHEICRRISTHQIRNVSTIGGNISRVFPWADLPVVLLAMNARMVIHSAQDRELSADEFFASQPAKRFLGGDLLTAVKIPVLQDHQGFGSVKVTRNAAAFSMVTIATVLEFEDGHIKAARVSAGSAIPFPRRLLATEASLIGREPTTQVFKEAGAKAAAEAAWTGREGMSPAYTAELVQVTVADALERAATFARGRDGQ
jgi:2-furoyl-CoA dehydrogenase FAD binding subunit